MPMPRSPSPSISAARSACSPRTSSSPSCAVSSSASRPTAAPCRPTVSLTITAARLHLFRAVDHFAVAGNEDPTLGWGGLLNGRVRIFDVPGDHRTVVKRGAADHGRPAAGAVRGRSRGRRLTRLARSGRFHVNLTSERRPDAPNLSPYRPVRRALRGSRPDRLRAEPGTAAAAAPRRPASIPRLSIARCSPATTSTSSPAVHGSRRIPCRPTVSICGRLSELSERNQYILRDLLEKAAKADPKRDAVDQKIGDYYASCMDEAAIEAKGLAPLQPQLDRIAALKSKRETRARSSPAAGLRRACLLPLRRPARLQEREPRHRGAGPGRDSRCRTATTT